MTHPLTDLPVRAVVREGGTAGPSAPPHQLIPAGVGVHDVDLAELAGRISENVGG